MKKKVLIYTMAAGLVFGSLGSVLIPAVAAQKVGPGIEKEVVNMELTRIWGQVTKVDKENNRIYLDNRSPDTLQGELVLSISEEQTRILSAVDENPANLDEITEGETIYAYIGPAISMSLPPIASPAMILCKIPADFRVPEYITVDNMEKQEDGSYILKATNHEEYAVPEDCTILPYLTRQMMYLDFLTQGNQCLVWMGQDNQVYKIVVFAE